MNLDALLRNILKAVEEVKGEHDVTIVRMPELSLAEGRFMCDRITKERYIIETILEEGNDFKITIEVDL